MKFTLISLLFLTVGINASSQDRLQWESVYSDEKLTVSAVEIHYEQPTDDIDHQRIIFKYENHTKTPLQITFQRQLDYNGNSLTQEQSFTVTVPPNQIVKYDAGKKNDKTFYVFKKDNQGFIKNTLTQFTIIHMNINNYETK